MGDVLERPAVAPLHRNTRVIAWLRNGCLALALVFVAANLVLSLLYYHRVLPRTYLGTLDVGGKRASALEGITAADVLPAQLTLTHGSSAAVRTPGSLGIDVDVSRSTQELATGWHWLPAVSLLRAHHAALSLHTNRTQYATAAALLRTPLSRLALGRHIGLDGTTFRIKPASNGYALNTAALLPAILGALQHGENRVSAPARTIAAPASVSANLDQERARLQQELNTPVSFTYQDSTVRTTAAERGRWFVSSGTTMTTSTAATRPYISQLAGRLGISIANPDDLATAAAYAATQTDAHTLAAVPTSTATAVRTYCTAAKDVDAGILSDLEGKLAITYNDARGWNDGGRIAFEHVTSGCQYTVWMSASADMTGFGAICDNYYNCQVGTNVILNYDRWTSATPPWKAAGGTMQDYRTLMIDHETGHRLGFRDNPTCPGPGEPAPVMMQQSIDLKGCMFNIWPQPAEFDQLNQMLGTSQAVSVTNLQ